MARAIAQWVKRSAHEYADPSSDLQHPQKARCSSVLRRRADSVTGFKLTGQEIRPKNPRLQEASQKVPSLLSQTKNNESPALTP